MCMRAGNKKPLHLRGSATLLIPLILRLSAGIGTLSATLQAGCRASQGRFPPPLLMRADLHPQRMFPRICNCIVYFRFVSKYTEEIQGMSRFFRGAYLLSSIVGVVTTPIGPIMNRNDQSQSYHPSLHSGSAKRSICLAGHRCFVSLSMKKQGDPSC